MKHDQHSFLFYDLETSGLNKAFDQVLQFAGKRLDSSFNEEQESHFYEAALCKDILPSPYAMLTHGIGIHAHAHADAESRVITNIHEHMNTPNTISLGYNTLGFDDEFLRFSFYRNLLPSYTHQYASGCMRMDVFPIAVFYYLYASECIRWPQIEGKVSLKLENIGLENGWFQGAAHHAMHDVDATIALAKAFKEAQPDMWDYCTGFFHKNIDYQRISELPEALSGLSGHHLGLMVHAPFGANTAFQAPVISLGRHNHYKNQIVFLRLDQAFDTLYAEDLEASGLIIRKKLGEPGFLLPFDEHYARHMSVERKRCCENNLAKLRLAKRELADIAHAAREYTHPSVEGIDIDAGLYEYGFKSGDEERLCHQFHITDHEGRIAMLESFKNPLLKEQALRFIWRNDAESLPDSQKKRMQAFMQKIIKGDAIIDYRGNKKNNVPDMLSEVTALLATPQEPSKQKLLQDYQDYLNELASSC